MHNSSIIVLLEHNLEQNSLFWRHKNLVEAILLSRIAFFSSRMCKGLAAIVRIELSLVNQASNKNTWNSHVSSMTSEFLPPTSSWTSVVTWVCHVFLLDAWLNQVQLDSHGGRIQWGICLARPKISNMFDFILTASRGEFLTTISPHTWGNEWANRLAWQFTPLFPHRVRRA